MSPAKPISPTIPPGPVRLSLRVIVGAIFGITLLAYFPALTGGQLWDDPAHLTAPALQSWSGLWRIWFQLGATQQYYPVLHSAFWLEHKLWGDSVLGYHLINVGLHATAACLFALVLVRIRPPAAAPRRHWRTEWLAAVVFALHPVGVESVAWISEQKNTLSLVFYLLAALAYFRFDRGRRREWYALALVLFVLALMSKSVTATLPAALLLGLYWRRGHLAWARDVLPLLPWFVIGAGAGFLTAWVEHHFIGAQGSAYEFTFLQRCFLAGRVVWFYAGKLVWPTNLMFIYPRWRIGGGWFWSFGAIGLAGVFAMLWWLRRWSRAPLVAVLFFAGSLFPALGFVNVYPFVFSYVADHWQYLPCLGIIVLATEGGAAVVQRWLGRLVESRRPTAAYLCALLVAVVLVILFGLTWRQAHIYRNVTTLYSDTLAKNPECWMAHNNLGLYLMESGSLPESMVHYREAIRLKPDYSDAHNNLGNALSKTPGRSDEAIAAFEQALRLEPDMPQAHANLGGALAKVPGRLEEAILHLRRAVQLQPSDVRAYNSLGVALTKSSGGLGEAIAAFETALRFNPDYVEARINLGNALVRAGRPAAAILQLQGARRLNPDDAKIHYNLGTALARDGRLLPAAEAFEQALQIEPDNAEAHNNLGNVLLQLGREPEAVIHYRTSLHLDPASVETHFNLARALRASGDGSEAIAEYRESLRLAPGTAEIWNSLGSFLIRLDKTAEAVAACATAVRLQPDSAPFHNNLGIALTGAGRLDEAITQFREALRGEAPFADAHYNLAVALQQAGRMDEAAVEFTASGRAQP